MAAQVEVACFCAFEVKAEMRGGAMISVSRASTPAMEKGDRILAQKDNSAGFKTPLIASYDYS